ncbi:hypothetical protein ACE6H2_006551 [Prunus campanulata]
MEDFFTALSVKLVGLPEQRGKLLLQYSSRVDPHSSAPLMSPPTVGPHSSTPDVHLFVERSQKEIFEKNSSPVQHVPEKWPQEQMEPVP